MTDVDAVLKDAVVFALDIATDIAVIRHEKKWVKKSKIPSDKSKAILEWLGSKHGKEAVKEVLRAATQYAQHRGAESLIEKYKHLLRYLVAIRELEIKPPGRPKLSKQGGLLAQAFEKKRHHFPGRPSKFTIDEEKKWIERVRGTALALWANDNGVARGQSIDEVVAIYNRNDMRPSLTNGYISRAVEAPSMAEFNPPSKSLKSLKVRASKALKTYHLSRKMR